MTHPILAEMLVKVIEHGVASVTGNIQLIQQILVDKGFQYQRKLKEIITVELLHHQSKLHFLNLANEENA